jgi:hypothetical protein
MATFRGVHKEGFRCILNYVYADMYLNFNQVMDKMKHLSALTLLSFIVSIYINLLIWHGMHALTMADLGFLEGGFFRAKRVRKFRCHAHFRLKPRPLSIVFESNY